MKRDFSKLTPPEKALEKLFDTLGRKPLRLEDIPVYKAYGRVLGEDIVSHVDIPPFPSALMDGYAVRAEDTTVASETNPVKLKVIGAITLGKKADLKVGRGEACYIPTGGFLPQGTNAVIKVEDIKKLNEHVIIVSRKTKSGNYVSPKGEDIKKGELIFKKGQVLGARDISVLAALRVKEVKVVKKVVAAILSVGDELVDHRRPVSDVIRVIDSHSLMVAQMLKENGATPYELGIVPDDPKKIMEKLKEGLAKADVVLTIGGCSQGEKDYVPDVIDSIGKPGMIVHGIAIRPGRVTGLAVVEGKPIVVLPGLPQSTFVGFVLFAVPLIRSMLGLPKELPYFSMDIKIGEEISVKGNIKRFIFVKLATIDGELFAFPLHGESNMLSNIVKADGFIITREGETLIREGQKVQTFLFKETLHSSF